MTGEGPLKPVGLSRHRDAAITRLCDHFAADHIDADELERLIDRAHAATTVAELNSLTADLPSRQETTLPAATSRSAVTPVQEVQTVVAIMSGVERKGSWLASRLLRAFAVMGGVELDFREVVLPPGVTEVQVFAMMGGVEILVPPGVRVSSEGFGIMGGFEQRADATLGIPAEDAPILRITGFALMGGVEIFERLPGESQKEAEKRRKRLSRGKDA